VLPCRDPQRAELVRELVAQEDAAELVDLQVGDPGRWLSRCRAALVKSGTGSLEACLHGAPSVVVYVLDHVFSRWFVRNLLTVPWFAVANLCMNREIVPELAIAKDGDWDRAEALLLELFEDGERRARCVRDLAELRSVLGEPGASARAAQWVLPFCRKSAS
jgi:lipid-A-disaccharide synthase